MARSDWAAKLKVLAERGSTPGERAAAAAALRRIETTVEKLPQPVADTRRSVKVDPRGEYKLVPVGRNEWVWRWVPSRRKV